MYQWRLKSELTGSKTKKQKHQPWFKLPGETPTLNPWSCLFRMYYMCKHCMSGRVLQWLDFTQNSSSRSGLRGNHLIVFLVILQCLYSPQTDMSWICFRWMKQSTVVTVHHNPSLKHAHVAPDHTEITSFPENFHNPRSPLILTRRRLFI